MRSCDKGKNVAIAQCQWNRTAVLRLVSVAMLCQLVMTASKYPPIVVLAPMAVDALFLMTSSHHSPSPPSSRVPKSGPSTTTSSKPEPNTKLRPRESRSASPLFAFYGMVLGRLGYCTKRGEIQRSKGKETDGNTAEGIGVENFDDENRFSEDMIQRKQEFRKRYENFRGRGRWGGYSLLAIQQESYPEPAPLPVESTAATTKVSTLLTPIETKLTRHNEHREQSRRTMPLLKVTDIHQYKDEIVDSTDSSLVVVCFYASWCKACKAIEGSYHRLPEDFPPSVKFVEVPLTKENSYMHKGLGIPSLPFAHIYYNDDHIDNNGTGVSSSSPCRLVDELKINKRKFSEFRRTIRSYVNKKCDVYYAPETKNGNRKGTITSASASPLRQTKIEAVGHKPEAIPTH